MNIYTINLEEKTKETMVRKKNIFTYKQKQNFLLVLPIVGRQGFVRMMTHQIDYDWLMKFLQ
jgi:hypothetical protein